MNTDTYLDGIKEWFDNYNFHLWEIREETEEARKHLLSKMDDIEPRLLESANFCYVLDCVEKPIRKIQQFIKENRRCQDLESIAYNEFTFEIEEMLVFLEAIPVEYRKLVLDSIDCPEQYHSDLKEGILQPNFDSLMKVAKKVDLKKDFSQMGFFQAFAQKYGRDSEHRISLMEDIMTVKYINNGYTYSEIRKFFLLDKEYDAGMSIWAWIEKFCESYLDKYYCFTNLERLLINRILKDEHFIVIGKEEGVDIESIMSGESSNETGTPQLTPQIEEAVQSESAADFEIIEDEGVIKSSTNPEKKQRWRLQRYLSRPVQPSKEGQLHCQGIKKSITIKGDSALQKFIQGIADRGYIDDDPITKNSFAYALSGRGGFKTEIIKVPWHHDKVKKGIPESVRVLLYISKHMFDNTTGDTYTQLFKVLDAETNPCIKDGMDQSSSYADQVSEDFKNFYNSCFEKKSK